MTVMNAFHPDYVKTYHPELLTTIKRESDAKQNGERFGKLARAHRESDGSKPSKPLSQFPSTKERVLLAPKEFHIFQKAGMPKGKK